MIKPLCHLTTAFFFFAIGTGIHTHAQNSSFVFEQIGLSDGLSQSYVDCILQDHRGFLWFGTTGGLNRYDGYEFLVHQFKPFEPNSLSDNRIQSIFEDHARILWLGTHNGGLNRLDYQTGLYTHFMHSPDNPSSISDNMVFQICESSVQPGVLWVSTNHGLNKLILTGNEGKYPKATKFEHFFHDPSIPESLSCNNVRSLLEDSAGNLWVGTWKGLNILDQKTGHVTRMNADFNASIGLCSAKITTLFEDHNRVIWVGTLGGGLNQFSQDRSTYTQYMHDPNDITSLSGNTVNAIFEDSSGRLWIGCESGLNQFDSEKKAFTRHQNDPSNLSSLSHNSVLSLYQSASGVIWVGTNTGGINRFSPDNNVFTSYKNNPENSNSLQHNSVYSFFESPEEPGIIWVGTEEGKLHRLDQASQLMTPYSLDESMVSSIVADSFGVLWIGCSGGLIQFNPKTAFVYPLRHDPNDPHSISQVTRINVLHFNPETPEFLWVGFDNAGLSQYNFESEKFAYQKHIPNDPTSISDNSVTCIVSSFTGKFWIGTKDGLNYFDPGKSRFRRFYHNPDDHNSLSSNYIRSVYEDKNRILWVGTDNGGLNKLAWVNPDEFGGTLVQVTHYGEKSGLPNSVVYGILEDGSGNLWLSSNKGLSRFNIQAEKFRNFDRQDGLLGNEFNTGAYFKSRQGEMFFGGINGFNSFFPDKIKDNPHIPPIVFTDFQLFNESISPGPDSPLKQPISVTKEIVLSHDQHVFSLEFVALDYADSRKNKYKYHLEGFDDGWNEIGSRRFITFTNLPAGSYTLRVKGSNNDGVWSREGASMELRVRPAWWGTSWAFFLYILTGASLLYAGVYFKINRERMRSQLKLERIKAEHLGELDHMKSRFFANISHEFRTPLTLILGPMEQWMANGSSDEVRHTAELVTRNAHSLLTLVNELLDLSKLDTGKLHLKAGRGEFTHLVKSLFFAFESHAQAHGIQLEFQSEVDRLDVYYDADKMEKIWNNLFSNAVKFTPEKGKILVSITAPKLLKTDHRKLKSIRTDEMAMPVVHVRVWNSGQGISAKHLPYIFDRFYQAGDEEDLANGCGIGLALAKELIELHHGSIHAASDEGHWTEFTLIFPLGRAHLETDEIVADHHSLRSTPADGVKALEEVLTLMGKRKKQDVFASNDNSIVILVVEDNQDMRKYIAEILSEIGVVIQAPNGKLGFEKATQLIPTLIISDVMMPGMDGYEFCRELKDDERTSHVPIILLTAKSSQECKLEGLKMGADDYLVKPFDSTELLVRVKNLIEQRRHLRKRFRRIVKLQPSDIAITPADETFLIRCIQLIEEHMEDPNLKVEWLAREIGLSRSQLHRKLHGLVDQTTSAFIRTIRLKRAVSLMGKKAATVSEIMYKVGFNSPPYFRKCFREQFGLSPSEYLEQGQKD